MLLNILSKKRLLILYLCCISGVGSFNFFSISGSEADELVQIPKSSYTFKKYSAPINVHTVEGIDGVFFSYEMQSQVWVTFHNDVGENLWKISVTDPANIEIGKSQINHDIIYDGEGGVCVTWQYDDDVFVQRINNFGIRLWGAYAIKLCNAPRNQQLPQIIRPRSTDGEKSIIISWMDNRAQNWDIYVNRLNFSDPQLQWTLDGLAVVTASRSQKRPRMVDDGDGGVIITWMDDRFNFEKSIFKYDPDWVEDYHHATQEFDKIRSHFVYVQRIDKYGNIIFNTNGNRLSYDIKEENYVDWEYWTADIPLGFPEIVSDENGGAIICWQKYGFWSTDIDLVVQKIDSLGHRQWASPYPPGGGWPMNEIEIVDAGYPQINHQMVSDGEGGFYIVWEDYNYYQHTPGDLSRPFDLYKDTGSWAIDSFFQHFYSNGTPQYIFRYDNQPVNRIPIGLTWGSLEFPQTMIKVLLQGDYLFLTCLEGVTNKFLLYKFDLTTFYTHKYITHHPYEENYLTPPSFYNAEMPWWADAIWFGIGLIPFGNIWSDIALLGIQAICSTNIWHNIEYDWVMSSWAIIDGDTLVLTTTIPEGENDISARAYAFRTSDLEPKYHWEKDCEIASGRLDAEGGSSNGDDGDDDDDDDDGGYQNGPLSDYMLIYMGVVLLGVSLYSRHKFRSHR